MSNLKSRASLEQVGVDAFRIVIAPIFQGKYTPNCQSSNRK